MDVCGQLPQVPLFSLPPEKTFTLLVSGSGGQTPFSGTFEDTLHIPLRNKCHPSPRPLPPAVYMCVHVCVCICSCLCACGVCMFINVCVCVCLHMFMLVCVYSHVHVLHGVCACAHHGVCAEGRGQLSGSPILYHPSPCFLRQFLTEPGTHSSGQTDCHCVPGSLSPCLVMDAGLTDVCYMFGFYVGAGI